MTPASDMNEWRERLEALAQVAWERRDRQLYDRIRGKIRLHDLANEIADRYKIPRHAFWEYITDTSNWDSLSEGPNETVGLCHLDPISARYFGLVVNDERDERYDPEKSLDTMARFALAAVDLCKEKGGWFPTTEH